MLCIRLFHIILCVALNHFFFIECTRNAKFDSSPAKNGDSICIVIHIFFSTFYRFVCMHYMYAIKQFAIDTQNGSHEQKRFRFVFSLVLCDKLRTVLFRFHYNYLWQKLITKRCVCTNRSFTRSQCVEFSEDKTIHAAGVETRERHTQKYVENKNLIIMTILSVY